jgi:hypothetical protein
VLSEPRPALYLDPPALVIGEVQVQDVELEECDVVYVLLHFIDRIKVPRDVKHRTAVLVPGMVNDRRRGNHPFCVDHVVALDVLRQQLPK